MSTYTVSRGGSLSNGDIPWTSNGAYYDNVIVLSGGTVSRETVRNGGSITVSSGGSSVGALISSGGALTFTGGGSGTYTSLLPGGTLNIGSGTTYDNKHATSLTALSGAHINVFSGGVLSNADAGAGGSITVSSGGSSVGALISSGGALTFTGGGSGTYTSLLSGGTLNIGSGTTYDNKHATSLTALSGAHINVFSGGVLSNADAEAGGSITVSSGGSSVGTVISSGGALTFTGGGSGTYTSLLPGGTLNIGSGTTYDNKHATSLTALSGAHINVFSGGVLSNADAEAGGSITVSSGGSSVGALISSGGALTFTGGGSGTYTSLLPGGTLNIGSGTTYDNKHATSLTALSGAHINVFSGGVLSNADAGAGGSITVSSGGSSVGALISSGGALTFTGGGSGTYTSLLPGGTLNIGSGTTYDNKHATSLTALSGAHINVFSGGVLSNADAGAGGSITVSSGGTVYNTVVSSGGVITVSSAATISDIVTIAEGGTATIWNTAGGTVDLVGDSNHGLTISGLENGGNVSTIISGWSGSGLGNSDRIDLAGISSTGATYSYPSSDQVLITLSNQKTITLNIPGVKTKGFVLTSDGRGGSFAEVCFLAGSMIHTPDGARTVEEIQIGDHVVTFDWRNNTDIVRPVVWVGKAHVNVRPGLPDDEAGYPVRVIKDAISDGVPYKDMRITAEHCLFFEGKFVPVRMLVNGRSIFYDKSITSYDYYHVETEQHSVITADGMLTESYLDTGNRRSFRQEGKVVLLGGTPRSWEEHGAADLSVSREIVEPLFRQIEARAEISGLTNTAPVPVLTEDADLHLVTTDGRVIHQARQANGYAMFMIPSNVTSVRIASRTCRPSGTIGPFVDDRRHLGVLVGEVSFFDSQQTRKIDTHLTDAGLIGWDVQEASSCRWTNGKALLPLGERQPNTVGMLAIQILAAGPYNVSSETAQAAVHKT